MKKISIITLITLCVPVFSLLHAQENKNLVPNGSFEELSKKPKEPGQISLAPPWTSPTMAAADIYTSGAKDPRIGVPDNAYGNEKPFHGNNYAGFLAYSYKNAEPRRYLQVQLTQALEAGKKYCVSFKLSAADLSKFACNGIGVYFSQEEYHYDNKEPLAFVPQVKQTKDPVFDKQFWWTDWCNTYKAKGDEQYMIIGNFTPDAQLQLAKLKKSADIKAQQTNDAYYFIDDVSVVEIDEKTECDCGLGSVQRFTIEKRNFQSDPKDISTSSGESTASTSPTHPILFFEKMKFSLTPEHETILQPIIESLKKPENKNKTLEIVSHSDSKEPDNAGLSKKRADVLTKYLISKGIAKERIKVTDKKSTEPLNEKNKDSSRIELIVK